MTIVSVYSGPQCPRCSVALAADWIRSGAIICPACGRGFEATAFNPPVPRREAATEVTAVGPEGANACANHARNAATASCQRCGVFICALCDMNIGTGSYCPSCFDRVRTEGSLTPAARRYRDHASIARTAAIAGLFFSLMFLGMPFGAVATWFAAKARKQRRSEGRSIAGVTGTMIVGILEVLIGIAAWSLLIYSLFNTARP